MRIAAGIILLVAGVSYPIGILFWLNARLRRVPPLLPRQVGLILAFNGVFPITIIGLGVGLLSSRLWAVLPFRLALLITGVVSLVLLLSIWRQSMVARPRS